MLNIENLHMSLSPFALPGKDEEAANRDRDGSGKAGGDAQQGGLNAQSSAVSQLLVSTIAAQNLSTNAMSDMASALSKRRLENFEEQPNTKLARIQEDIGHAPRPEGISAPDQLRGNLGMNLGNYPNNINVTEMLRAMNASQQQQDPSRLNSNPSALMGDGAMRLRAAQLLQEHRARNALSLASLQRPNIGMFFNNSQLDHLQQQLGNQDQQAQIAALRNLAELDALQRSGNRNLLSSVANSFPLPGAANDNRPDLAAFLQLQQAEASAARRRMSLQEMMRGPGNSPSMPVMNAPSQAQALAAASQPASELPLCEEGPIQPHMKRNMFPLGIDEDPNWLSEFHCFVRSELVEVFRASHEDVKARNNSIAYQQVGLRCRFCAHMTSSARAGRSSAFPSSLRQIYQSFTMMLRDHFGSCDAIPGAVQQKFTTLKDKPAQGATDSKRFWIYSAMKIGMADSPEGIFITDRTRAAGIAAPPFGTPSTQSWEDDTFRSVPLVFPMDRSLVSEFLFVLMSQVQLIRLTEAERIGNRRSLRVGLPGFSCRYCCEHRRLGLCRMFPARRRTLPSKVNDIYDHMRRCTVCPASVKEHLERTKHQLNTGYHADQGGDREFFDRIWSRLGHGGNS